MSDLLKEMLNEANKQHRTAKRRLIRQLLSLVVVIGLSIFGGIVYGWQMGVIVFLLGLLAVEVE